MTPEQRASAAAARTAKAQLEEQWTNGVLLARAGESQLKKTLHEPGSYALQQALLVDFGNVCLVYRAKNGFGAMRLGQAVAIAAGHRLDTSDATYRKHCNGKNGRDLTPAV